MEEEEEEVAAALMEKEFLRLLESSVKRNRTILRFATLETAESTGKITTFPRRPMKYGLK